MKAPTTRIVSLLNQASRLLKRNGREADAASMTSEGINCDTLAGAWLVVRRYLEGEK